MRRVNVNATHGVAFLLAFLFLGLTPRNSGAAPLDLNIQNFRPSMDTRSLITVERSRPLGTLEQYWALYELRLASSKAIYRW